MTFKKHLHLLAYTAEVNEATYLEREFNYEEYELFCMFLRWKLTPLRPFVHFQSFQKRKKEKSWILPVVFVSILFQAYFGIANNFVNGLHQPLSTVKKLGLCANITNLYNSVNIWHRDTKRPQTESPWRVLSYPINSCIVGSMEHV